MNKLWRAVLSFAYAAAMSLSLSGCPTGDSTPAQVAPLPVALTPAAAPRTDGLYGYYGSWEGQEAAVKDHTNVGWAGAQWGTDNFLNNTFHRIQELRDAGACVILDVPAIYNSSDVIGEVQDQVMRANAADSVRAYFNELKRAKQIGPWICALYPFDEPDAAGFSAQFITERNELLREIAKEYDFVANIPIYTIYTCHHGFTGVESVDWASVDDYDSKAGVIEKCVKPLKARLRPMTDPRPQRLLLTPGGFQCDDPKPFYDFFQSDPQVLGFTTFIWFKDWGGTSNPGVENAPCRASYVNLGHQVKGS